MVSKVTPAVMNKELGDVLTSNYEEVRSRIHENRLDEAIYLMDSLSATFKLQRSSYDRSTCTPYSDEVTRTYGLKEYVNASFVPVQGTLFIAAQDPKYSKIDVFLELLVRSRTKLVVSLIKDTKYFNEEWLSSRRTIQHMGKDLFIDETYEVLGESIRRLRYIDWVDFSIISPSEMELFHSYFDSIRTESVLVHCIAGVGRTGTFIMYDILKRMEELTLDVFVDVFIGLRKKRAHLVTNGVQLGFLKDVFLKNHPDPRPSSTEK